MLVLLLPRPTDVLDGPVESGHRSLLLLKGCFGADVVIHDLDEDWEVGDCCSDRDVDHDWKDLVHGCQLDSSFVADEAVDLGLAEALLDD